MGEEAPRSNEEGPSTKQRLLRALGASSTGDPGRHLLGNAGEALSAQPIPPDEAPIQPPEQAQ